MQHLEGLFPILLEYKLIKIRNDVIHGAAVITKWSTAIHATCCLRLCLRIIKANHELFVILEPILYRQVALFEPLKLHESRDLSHQTATFSLPEIFFCSSSANARRYSFGNTLTNFARAEPQ